MFTLGGTVSAPDFANISENSTTINIGVAITVVILICALVLSIKIHDYELLVLSFPLACMIGFVFIAVNMTDAGDDYTKAQISDLRAYASENYLLSVTDNQAEKILQNQIDLTDSESKDKDDDDYVDTQTQDKVEVKNVYGEKVDVGLIHNNNKWSFVVMQDVTTTIQVTK